MYQPVSPSRGKGIAITTTVLAVLCAGVNLLAAASVVLMHLFFELLDAVQIRDSLKPESGEEHSTSVLFVAAAAVLTIAATALTLGIAPLIVAGLALLPGIRHWCGRGAAARAG